MYKTYIFYYLFIICVFNLCESQIRSGVTDAAATDGFNNNYGI